MKKIVFFDLETYSPVDLRKKGAVNYTQHPDFRIVIGCFKVGNKSKVLVGHSMVRKMVEEFLKNNYTFVAHNMSFEYACLKDVFDKYKAKEKDLLRCTMVMGSYYLGLQSLYHVAQALDTKEQKLMNFTQTLAVKWVIKHKGNIEELKKEPKNWQDYLNYCKVDVDVLASIYKESEY